MALLQGLAVYHKQLGLGKITAVEEENSWVDFLFFAPGMLVSNKALRVIKVSPEDQKRIQDLAKNSETINWEDI